MTFRIEFHPLALKEYVKAYNWYEDRSEGLGERFIKEVRSCLDTIKKNPYHFNIRERSFREARVDVFPYNIVYEIFKDEALIFISAIYHGKRNPRKKFRKRKK